MRLRPLTVVYLTVVAVLLSGSIGTVRAEPVGAERYLFGLANEMLLFNQQEWQPVVLELDTPRDWDPSWEAEGVAVPVLRVATVRPGVSPGEITRTLAGSPAEGGRSKFYVSKPTHIYEQQTVLRALRRLSGAKFGLLIGIRSLDERAIYVLPISPHDRGMAAPVIPLERAELTAAVEGALLYVDIANRERIDLPTWERVRRIQPLELRFLAARDVLAASYTRGLARAPTDVRLWLIRGTIPDTHDTLNDAAFRLRIAILVGVLDRSVESCVAVVGTDQTWLVEVVAKGTKESSVAALSVASSWVLESYVTRVGGEMAMACLERGDGLTPGELASARALAAKASVSSLDVGEHPRAIVEGLLRSKDVVTGASQLEVAQLILDLGRVFPKLPEGIARVPSDRREQLESWATSMKPRTAEDEEALRSLKTVMGWR